MRRSVYALHLVSPRILKLSGAPIKPSNFHRQRHAKAFEFSAWLRRQEGIVRDLISPGYPATKRGRTKLSEYGLLRKENMLIRLIQSGIKSGGRAVNGNFFAAWVNWIKIRYTR